MVEMYAMRIAHNNVHFSHVTLDCANIRYCQLNLVTSPETVKVFLFPTAELQRARTIKFVPCHRDHLTPVNTSYTRMSSPIRASG